jgi:protein-arginine kinase activator protein McsA
MHPCDKICHLCKERKSIFAFQTVYMEAIGSSVYICHSCTIEMQRAAILKEGLDNVNILSTPRGEFNTP